MSVYTYSRDPSGRAMCTVSACKRAPGYAGAGLEVASCGRFHGERVLSRPLRESVRCTDERETETPFAISSQWTTCPHLRRPILCLTIAWTTWRGSARGDRLGFDESVGISCHPPVGSFRHHFKTVDGCTPYLRATFRIDHPRYLTNCTASRRTLGMCGFCVYAMHAIFAE